MTTIGVAEYSLALAVLGLGELSLTLCLVRAYYDPQSISKLRCRLLNAAIVTYPLVSAAFCTAFFITRRISRTYNPSFALFYTWEIVNGLCLATEIVRFVEH
jgi:FtsH-binding integral membrane protein